MINTHKIYEEEKSQTKENSQKEWIKKLRENLTQKRTQTKLTLDSINVVQNVYGIPVVQNLK